VKAAQCAAIVRAMRPAARIQACIELLNQQQNTKKPADRVQAQYFRERRYIGSKDKAAISEYYYRVLRQRGALDYRLHQSRLAFTNRLRMALLLGLDKALLPSLFNGEKFAPKPLKDEEPEKLEYAQQVEMAEAPFAAKLNFPEWLEDDLSTSLGERFELEMASLAQRAPLDVRVNLLLSQRQDVFDRLTHSGLEAELCRLSPWGIRIHSKIALTNIEEFNQGLIEVQDEGSQLLALLTRAKAKQRVIDFCAGAGGKTLALAGMMQNKGTIWACDVHSKRLEQLSKRKKRAQAHNIRSHLLSSEKDKWVKQHAESADIVLIDAPCTGTGTWRRSPDARWNLTAEDLAELVELQASILQSAQRLLKPGGRLFYATCSVLKQENQDQIMRFLNANQDFEASQIELPEDLLHHSDKYLLDGHCFQCLPTLSGTDGFFLSCLTKKS